MKNLILLFVIGVIFLFSSCKKDTVSSIAPVQVTTTIPVQTKQITKTDQLKVASDFIWKTYKDVQITLSGTNNSIVEVASTNNTVYQRAYLAKDLAYNMKLSVPSYETAIHLLYMGIDTSVNLSSNNIVYTFNSQQVLNSNNHNGQTTITNNFPCTGYGTLAFEDLWPYKGDYDMNDLVLDYKFVISSNTNNYVEKVVGTFVIKAFGASLENGFGFQLPGIANSSDLTVTGYSLKESFINLNSKGTELGQAKPTIIVFDNAFKQMASPGGTGVNTDPNQPYVKPVTLTITIDFKPNTYKLNDLDIANFNPFLIVNKVRGVEVHLPDYAPTSLANTKLLGTGDDNSIQAQNRYYKTANNLPWAINTYGQFDYPKEKEDISQAYLHFAAWAISSGHLFSDWYNDFTGYRNTKLIYQVPQ